jgi:ArsR family transcriptional regulator
LVTKINPGLSLDLVDCAPTESSRPLAREKAENIASLLRAVSDPTRLQILALISQADQKEACVCNMTKPLGLSQPTISHHLKKLAEAGLINRERRGTWVWYSLNKERWQEVAGIFQ